MILPTLLLTLDKYSSGRVGRVGPMIRLAVRTTIHSLLWSDLVAELNQTVINVQSQVKSSHLYLYSAFNHANCNKALYNIKIGKLCQ